MCHRRFYRIGIVASLLIALMASPAVAQSAATLPVSEGVYRFPYATGAQVSVSRDHLNHGNNDSSDPPLGPRNRLDLVGPDSVSIVAAGDGWFEYIDDSNFLACPSDDDGDACAGYNGPAGATNCCDRDNPVCNGACRNNYIWIRHANGEWTKYSHMQTDSVPITHQVGDFVAAGTFLGFQGDIGFANGQHLHFQAGRPYVVDGSLPTSDPDYDPLGLDEDSGQQGVQCDVCGLPSDDESTDPSYNRQDRIPQFCDIGFAVAGNTIAAAPCNGACATDTSQLFGSVPDDFVFHRQVTETMSNFSNDFTVFAGGGAALVAGTSITLSPGFHAETDSYFSASIANCDRPGS